MPQTIAFFGTHVGYLGHSGALSWVPFAASFAGPEVFRRGHCTRTTPPSMLAGQTILLRQRPRWIRGCDHVSLKG